MTAWQIALQQLNPQAVILPTRKCNTCGDTKYESDFNSAGYNPDTTRRYRGACKECVRAAARLFYAGILVNLL